MKCLYLGVFKHTDSRSADIFSFALFIHWLAQAVSTQLSPISKIGRLSVCDLYVFSTGSQNVYLFLGHISHMGHVCLAAGSFPTHFGTTLLHMCVCLAAGSSPFVLAPHRFTCLSVCQHTSVHITQLDRVEGSSGDGLQRPRLDDPRGSPRAGRAGWAGRAGRAGRACLLYTSPSPRDATLSRMASSA